MKRRLIFAVTLLILLGVSACGIPSVPANQGTIYCDVNGHRGEIVQFMAEISVDHDFAFDDFDDRSPTHGFIAASGNGSGDVVVSYLGTTKILIDMQQPPFVDASEEDVTELVVVTEELVSTIRRICG